MIVNQANLHGLSVGYSTAFNKSFDTTQSNYQKVATVVPSTTGEQDYKWLGQMPGMREWMGEREIQALAAYDYLIKNKKFEMTIGVPRDDIEDDKYGVYTPLFSNMGEAAALHPDELVFGAMMSGFTEKCYDGLSFFNTAHKVGEKTYSNRSNKKLSRESYMEARSSIMSIKGDKGKSLKLVPDLLVVSPALEEEGKLILEADQIEGTTNVLKGTAKLHVEPALAEHPEYWFLLCTNRFLKPFIYQLRKKIKFVSLTKDTDENVFLLDEFLYGADGRSNAGYGFWQMAYGSTGKQNSRHRDRRQVIGMYCTVEEVLGMIKDDMRNVIIGDEYIEDGQEREAKIATLCEAAISDACAEIDGYLAKRYSVPFRRTPQVISKFAKDISVYNLVSRTGIDESDREKTFLNRYNAAIKFLLDVAKGIIDIGIDEKSGSSEAANGFKMKSSGRVFSRDSMRGW